MKLSTIAKRQNLSACDSFTQLSVWHKSNTGVMSCHNKIYKIVDQLIMCLSRSLRKPTHHHHHCSAMMMKFSQASNLPTIIKTRILFSILMFVLSHPLTPNYFRPGSSALRSVIPSIRRALQFQTEAVAKSGKSQGQQEEISHKEGRLLRKKQLFEWRLFISNADCLESTVDLKKRGGVWGIGVIKPKMTRPWGNMLMVCREKSPNWSKLMRCLFTWAVITCAPSFHFFHHGLIKWLYLLNSQIQTWL